MSRYLFIDGGFFRGFVDEMKKLAKPDLGEVDIDIHQVGLGFDRVLFYDAYPEQKEGQSDEEFQSEFAETERYLALIARTPNFNVRPALTRRGKRREQKGVDVLLAIECLLHAVRNNIDEAAIMTTDLDFYPLFEALLQTKTKSVLRYQVGRTSDELIQAADYAEPVTAADFADWISSECRNRLDQGGKGMGGHGLDKNVIAERVEVARGTVAEHKFQLFKHEGTGLYFSKIDGGIQGNGRYFRFLVEGQVEKMMGATIRYN